MKKKIVLFLIVGVLLAVVSILFYVFSQPSNSKMSEEEKEKAVTKLLGRKAILTDDTPQGDLEYKGKYISFKYPARATPYNYRENSTSSNSASLEDFSFDLKEPKIVFNLQVINGGTLRKIADYPAVRLRTSRAYEYTKAEIGLDNNLGVVYTKEENGGEKSGFWLIGDKIISVSITGSDIKAVNDLFDQFFVSAKIFN